jgi:hypothetical protein
VGRCWTAGHGAVAENNPSGNEVIRTFLEHKTCHLLFLYFLAELG